MVLAFIFIILASVIGIFLPLWEARGIFLKVRLLLISFFRHLPSIWWFILAASLIHVH